MLTAVLTVHNVCSCLAPMIDFEIARLVTRILPSHDQVVCMYDYPSLLNSLTSLQDTSSGMSSPHPYASHSQFNHAGRDQYNIVYTTTVTNQETLMDTLKPVDRSGYYVQPCMQGTRQWLVDTIHRWLNDQLAPNILWLSGSPGSGKSTIASTLVSQLGEMGWLCSSFFFKRGDIALSDPAALWRTVAFDLAQKDSFFAETLIETLKERRVDPTRADIATHFKYLIEDPLTVALPIRRATGAIRFPVVVLDALDECGSDPSQSTQRQIFMDTLIKWSRLHPSFKLVITSRDQNITLSFREVCHR